MEISKLQPVTADELGTKMEPLEKSVNNKIIQTSQLESNSESTAPEIEQSINTPIETAYSNSWDTVS